MKRFVDNLAGRATNLVMIIAVIFLALPILVAIGMAFDSRPYLAAFPPPSLSLQWFERFFSDNYFLRGLKTSLLLAAVVTVISTTIRDHGCRSDRPLPVQRRDDARDLLPFAARGARRRHWVRASDVSGEPPYRGRVRQTGRRSCHRDRALYGARDPGRGWSAYAPVIRRPP